MSKSVALKIVRWVNRLLCLMSCGLYVIFVSTHDRWLILCICTIAHLGKGDIPDHDAETKRSSVAADTFSKYYF